MFIDRDAELINLYSLTAQVPLFCKVTAETKALNSSPQPFTTWFNLKLLTMATKRRGKSPVDTPTADNKRRDERLKKLFNTYRWNPWIHSDSEYFGKLKPYNATKPLSEWMIDTPKHIKEATLICFFRCLNKRLTLKQMEKVDFVGIDIRFIKGNVDKKKILYTEDTMKTYMSVVMQSCNRELRYKINEWKRENLMNPVTPDWVTDESLLFDIDNHGYHFLKQEYKALKKLCGLVHGPTKRKAQGITESEWSFITHGMFAKYCPLGILYYCLCFEPYKLHSTGI